ncbi:MAG: hypothetical protein FE78DRAFT_29176 [Acidomyces sp. 'richmondensis']|nr:MAG: hypothetical protein FE78DRAFT_29176 [Acidomyces sp. 'richmondensis']
MILSANHFVFDETHIYGERAWGFLHFWMTAVAARYSTYPTRLTFLSATHSNMWDNFANDPEVLPPVVWTQFDEPISETAAGPGFRWLHGDVQVSIHPHHSIRELTKRILPDWLAAGHRILILYDSLRELAADMPILATLHGCCGLVTADWAGRTGAVGGEIWIAEPRTAVQGFDQQLLAWDNESGQHSIEDIRKTLGVLRKVNGPRAAVLGSAYWGMLKRHVRPVYVFLQEAHESLTGTPMPRDGLSVIHRRAREIGGRQGDQVLQWIQAVDRTLKDVRGFLPTVQFQFQNGPIITYNREWVLLWFDPPDRISDQGVWEYDRPRPAVLRDQPVAQIERWVLLPNGDIRVIPINLGRTGEAHAVDVYRQYIRESHLKRELREAIHEWIRRSRLIILASDPLSPTDSAIL